MIARIIPAIRTPRRVSVFDYLIPDGMTVSRGDLVRIPFRASQIIGVVKDLQPNPTDPKFAIKPLLGPYADLHLTHDSVTLLERLAIHAFTSEATILHAWLGTCPKFPGAATLVPSHAPTPPIREDRYLENHLECPEGILSTANAFIKDGSKVLILAPWAARAERIASRLNARLLTSSMPMGARFSSWSSFVRGSTKCLVATRIGAWLSAEADVVILDEPENDDHKQDELSPRFDARWITQQANTLKRSFIQIGVTPRLAADIPTQIPTLTPHLIAVDLHSRDWSPVAGLQHRTLLAIEEAVAAGQPVTIIHPIHGDRARLRCADCSWEPQCASCGAGLRVEGGTTICSRCHKKTPAITICATCGSSNLSGSRPGRERLEKDLRATIASPDIRIVSIGEWNASDVTPSHSLIVCTDLSLLSGACEDLRKKERLIIAMRRLADRANASSSTLCIQANYILLNEAKTWLTSDGLRDAFSHEFAERMTFKLPPAYRLAKIIFRGNEPAIRTIFERMLDDASRIGNVTIQGLYPVEHRGTREARWIAHVIAPQELPESAFLSALTPAVASDALIDLDPIAFFE